MSRAVTVEPGKNPFEGSDVRKIYEILYDLLGRQYGAKITIKSVKEEQQ